MDEKQRIIDDFLRSLRITVNHSGVYFHNHPVYVRAVEELKTKVNILLDMGSPMVISVAPDYLLINGAKVEQSKHANELAVIFHKRRIRNVTIMQGVTNLEISQFLHMVSTSEKGTRKPSSDDLLPLSSDAHIRIEGLDYFELLREGGDGEKDAWAYLLSQASQKTDGDEFKDFSQNFSRIMDRFKGRDFLEKPVFKQVVTQFLDSVKKTDPEKFGLCAKELARVILRDRTLVHEQKTAEFREFFKDVDVVDLSNTLWDEIINNEHFDFLTFKLFSQLVDKERHNDLAKSLSARLINDDILHNDVQIARRMKELFDSSEDAIALTYRKALDSFLTRADTEPGRCLALDANATYSNYRNILLNLLMLESRPAMLRPALDNIVTQWDRITESNDIEYIKNFLDILDKKKRLDPSLSKIFSLDEKKIFDFIEHKLLEEEDTAYFDLYFSIADKSSVNYDFYIAKIFNSRKTTPHIFKLFFKFFENNIQPFYTQIKACRKDKTFLRAIVKALSQVDSPLSVETLKVIFDIADDMLQVEVIRAIAALSRLGVPDGPYLLSLLPQVSMYLRKEIVNVLVADPEGRSKTADALFGVKNNFGSKNQLIKENIKIACDLKLSEALPYLKKISGSWSLFKLELASYAREALKKMDKENGTDRKS